MTAARSNRQANRVRIIGGRFRGRVIRFPAAVGLRPTPDRVRETVFNWLGQDLTGQSTLDLYAGSGALTLEALSRGAQRAVAVDSNADLVRSLEATAKTFGATGKEYGKVGKDRTSFQIGADDGVVVVRRAAPARRSVPLPKAGGTVTLTGKCRGVDTESGHVVVDDAIVIPPFRVK